MDESHNDIPDVKPEPAEVTGEDIAEAPAEAVPQKGVEPIVEAASAGEIPSASTPTGEKAAPAKR